MSPPAPITIDFAPDADIAGVIQSIPDIRAVVSLETADARTLMVAVTASARDFAQARLGVADTDAPVASSGRRADLSSVVRRIVLCPEPSALEAELRYTGVLREKLPREYEKARERWQTWWLGVDARSPAPRFDRRELRDWLGASRGVPGVPAAKLIGPFATRDAATYAADSLVDLFDLCRYDHILAQSPHGVACAYKEMGRCPAPCDGSESLDSYRARFASACTLACDGYAALEPARLNMRQHALAQRFELAAKAKLFLDGADKLLRGPLSLAASLEHFDWLISAPCPARPSHRLRILRARPRSVSLLAECEIGDPAPVIAALGDLPSDDSQAFEMLDGAQADALGIVSKLLATATSGKRSSMRALRLQDRAADPRAIRELVKRDRLRPEVASEPSEDQTTAAGN